MYFNVLERFLVIIIEHHEMTDKNTLCCWFFAQFPIFKPPDTIRSSIFAIFILRHDSTNGIVGHIFLNLSQRSSLSILWWRTWRSYSQWLWRIFRPRDTFSPKLQSLFRTRRAFLVSKVNIKSLTAWLLDNILDEEFIISVRVTVNSVVVFITCIFLTAPETFQSWCFSSKPEEKDQ